ncbi:YbaB/EbfC family nucleoid-associated protein [Candidatus Parcubacteria bacterium]|nr:YbaB/EbfC family nucleoid-associated protein [Candidatus Parcubacteria bacterium]
MFEKLKQIKKLKDLQSSLSQEKAEGEKNGIKVVINGKMEIEEIQLNPELSREEQQKFLKECLNETMKKVQMIAAQKMQQMGGF